MRNFKRGLILILVPLTISVLAIVTAQLLRLGQYVGASFSISLSQILIAYGAAEAMKKFDERLTRIESSLSSAKKNGIDSRKPILTELRT